MRTTFILLGHTSMALGFIGIVVPLLPTTPFVLLAAVCYSRGSDRFHTWLHRHHRFGPAIRSWRERGAIGVRAKVLASAMIAASCTVLLIRFQSPWNVVAAAVCVIPLVFVLTRPS